MKGLHLDRGFESMIPKKPEVKEEESLFKQKIEFKILGKRIKFSLEVN